MKFYISNQTVRADGIQPRIVSNSQDFVSCWFRFSSEWDNLVKVALFAQGEDTYTQLLSKDDSCMLPVEIGAGSCTVSIYGQEAGGTTMVTTNGYTLTVVDAGYYGEALAPTADLYSQLLREMVENTAVAAQYVTACEEAQVEVQTALEGAMTSEVAATQALSDLLAMLGTDIATLVDGAIPLSQIPATATQEIYVITSTDNLTQLEAQRGDLAELVEEVDGIKTITKTWQLLDEDATVTENWVVWGTSYAVQAGNATAATSAEDASKINGKRIVSMTEEQYQVAVTDPDTYYFVTTEE